MIQSKCRFFLELKSAHHLPALEQHITQLKFVGFGKTQKEITYKF